MRGEQGDDLAFESVPRGDQEAEVDQHEQGVGQHVLNAGRHGHQVAGGIELVDQLVQLGRGLQAEGVGQAGDSGLQPRRGVHQLEHETGPVVGDEQDGQGKHRQRDGHRHRHGGHARKPRNALLQQLRQAVDQDHQEQRQDQRRQDAPKPQHGGSGRHHRQQEDRVSHGRTAEPADESLCRLHAPISGGRTGKVKA